MIQRQQCDSGGGRGHHPGAVADGGGCRWCTRQVDCHSQGISLLLSLAALCRSLCCQLEPPSVKQSVTFCSIVAGTNWPTSLRCELFPLRWSTWLNYICSTCPSRFGRRLLPIVRQTLLDSCPAFLAVGRGGSAGAMSWGRTSAKLVDREEPVHTSSPLGWVFKEGYGCDLKSLLTVSFVYRFSLLLHLGSYCIEPPQVKLEASMILFIDSPSSAWLYKRYHLFQRSPNSLFFASLAWRLRHEFLIKNGLYSRHKTENRSLTIYGMENYEIICWWELTRRNCHSSTSEWV